MLSSRSICHAEQRCLCLALVLTACFVLTMLGRMAEPVSGAQSSEKQSRNRLLIWKEGRLASIRPNGGDFKWVTDPPTATHEVAAFPHARLSWDGRYVAFRLDEKDEGGNINFNRPGKLYVQGLDEPGRAREVSQAPWDGGVYGWSPNAKSLVAVHVDARPGNYSHWLLDVDTKQKPSLKCRMGTGCSTGRRMGIGP